MTTADRPIGEPGITELAERRIAYITMRGPYQQFPQAMERLLAWIESAKAVIVSPPGGTYADDPSTTPEAQLHWEAWTPVTPATPEQPANPDGIGVRTLPGGRYAHVFHRGPYDGVGAAYGLLFTWLAQQEIQPAGPPMEVYLSDPTETPEPELITEVQVPLA